MTRSWTVAALIFWWVIFPDIEGRLAWMSSFCLKILPKWQTLWYASLGINRSERLHQNGSESRSHRANGEG